MEEHDDQFFDFLNVRSLFAVFAVVATLDVVSGAAFGADKAPRVGEQWGKAAEVMYDNANEAMK